MLVTLLTNTRAGSFRTTGGPNLGEVIIQRRTAHSGAPSVTIDRRITALSERAP
jgi:hypothetical protein